jgi:hypothetical protein
MNEGNVEQEVGKYHITHNCAIGRIINTSEEGVIVSPIIQCNVKPDSFEKRSGAWGWSLPQLEFEQIASDIQYLLPADELWGVGGNCTEKTTWVEFEKIWDRPSTKSPVDFPSSENRNILTLPLAHHIIAFEYEIEERSNKAQISSAVPLNTPNCAHAPNLGPNCGRPVYIGGFQEYRGVRMLTRKKCVCGAGLCDLHNLCLKCEKSKDIDYERREGYRPFMFDD